MTEPMVRTALTDAGFTVIEVWESADVRPGRMWLSSPEFVEADR